MFRRTLLNCRMKTRVTILGFSVVFVCSLLMYRALTSRATVTHPGHSHGPSFDHNSHEIHPKGKPANSPRNNNAEETFQAQVKDLSNKDVVENGFETLKYRDLLNADSKKALMQFLEKLYPTNWAEAAETDEVALDLKYLLFDYGLNSNISCKQIDSLRLGSSVLHSGSQQIDYAYDATNEAGIRNSGFGGNSGSKMYDKSTYIVKSYSSDHETKIVCMKQVYDSDRCSAMGNYRLLREVLLLSALRHPNVVAMKGYCLRGNRVSTRLQEKGLIVLTETGTPLTMSVIISSTWAQKLSMALDICELLQYMVRSPLGSLRFTRLSLTDFVLVQGTTVKLLSLDGLEVGDKACTEDSDCEKIVKTKGDYCKNGRCEGLNGMINFNTALREVLHSVLHNPPGPDEKALLLKLRNMEISQPEFMKELQILVNKSKHEDHYADSRVNPDLGVGSEGLPMVDKHRNGDTHFVLSQRQQSNLNEVLLEFSRYDRKNFAGIYDYSCAGSRVSWGCVYTVTSLAEAAAMCLKDKQCKCFVTFSTQPESDNLMTVVLKNGSDSTPHKSSGTTLFVRHARQDTADVEETDRSETHKEKREASSQVQSCLDRLLQSQEMARYSREKRLMAHLGLKGNREQAWRRSALKQKMKGQSHLLKAKGGGGMFTANLTARGDGDEAAKAKKVVFMSEDGPSVYHMAFAVVYHLDRLLGLYHTPPCVGKKLPAEDVDQYLRKTQWDELFRSRIESDGTLSGLMIAPLPHIMKNTQLIIEPRQTMVAEIVPFSQSEKLQFEYILLWWLGKIDYTSIDHQGYRDHLVHFYADKAFGNLELDLSEYLNHCQFPNVAYKSLTCFWCDFKKPAVNTVSYDVCSLGEEAIKRSRAMFTDDSEFFIHNMREEELATVINSVASSILRKLNSCIQTFGRESVLY